MVDAIESLLTQAEVRNEEFCVLRGPGRPKHKVLGLFDEGVATKPAQWRQASMPERACMTVGLMAE